MYTSFVTFILTVNKCVHLFTVVGKIRFLHWIGEKLIKVLLNEWQRLS